MSLLEKTKFLLRKHRIYPNKLLGQNFMVDPSIFETMANYASLNEKDTVLDVGAGLGFLTRFLANKCKRVLAVESDARLVKVLREQLEDLPNAKIIEGDVLQVHIPQFDKVVSIPPYSISSLLFLWLFRKDFDCAVLIFQEEFANRVVASAGSESYGWLAVVAYYYVELEPLDDVPKWMFYPQPEVNSIVLSLKPKKPPPFTLKNKVLFRQLAQSLFTHSNRKVKNAVLSFMKGSHAVTVKDIAMVDAIPFRLKRVRELAPEDFGVLANALAE